MFLTHFFSSFESFKLFILLKSIQLTRLIRHYAFSIPEISCLLYILGVWLLVAPHLLLLTNGIFPLPVLLYFLGYSPFFTLSFYLLYCSPLFFLHPLATAFPFSLLSFPLIWFVIVLNLFHSLFFCYRWFPSLSYPFFLILLILLLGIYLFLISPFSLCLCIFFTLLFSL